MNQPSKIYSYSRVSTEQQKNSHDRIADQMRELVAKLLAAGCELGEHVQEEESAVSTRWNERPGFTRLMRLMDPGDHLIIEAKDRLERDEWGIEMLVCLRWMERRKIILHCLMNGGNAIDLSDDREQMLAHLESIQASQYAKHLKSRVKEGVFYRKVNGLCYHRKQPLGKRQIELPKAPGQKKAYKAWVWDEKQCSLLREIVRMREKEGMTFEQIGRTLRDRGERTQNGEQWTTPYYSNQTKSTRWSIHTVRIAYRDIKRLQEHGIDIGGVAMLSTEASSSESLEPSSLIST